MVSKSQVPSNRLLDKLASADRKRLLAKCTLADLTFGDVLGEVGEPIRYAWFPLDGFISMIAKVGRSTPQEVGIIGREGMFGVNLLLGIKTSTLHGVVQSSGTALRIPAADLRRQLAASPALTQNLGRYIAALLLQAAHTAVCVGSHNLEQRVARWMLMCDDRVEADSFQLTQRYLAYMIGVRREGVSGAANTLQRRGLIKYARGQVQVLDRRGLENASCPCYRADLKAYAQALG